MFLRLPIACCLASISAAQDIPQSATREIAAAANEFVATLDDSQQGKLIYGFRDEAQRKRWAGRKIAESFRGSEVDLSALSQEVLLRNRSPLRIAARGRVKDRSRSDYAAARRRRTT